MATVSHRILSLFAACAAGLGLPAQSAAVLPANHEAVAGTGSTNVPFGRSTPNRVQMAYDALLFSGPVLIERLGFRLDEQSAATASKMVDMEIRLSSLGQSITRLSEVFANNRGVDETVVFSRKIFELPGSTAGESPNTFHLQVDLDAAFAYDPANGALVVEVVIYGQQPGTFSLDTTFVCDSVIETVGPSGGCGSQPGGLTCTVETQQITWGRPVLVEVAGAPADGLTFLLFGARPLSESVELSPIGMPGCHLSIDIMRTFAETADPAGSALYSLFVPSIPELQGESLFFQSAALDAGANVLGVAASPGVRAEICGWEAVARVFASGTAAETGLKELGVAPVLQIGVQ